MLNKKTYLNFYTPMDGDGLARSLEKQARKGWHLTKHGDFLLHFEKDDPREIHYAVTFFPDATYYDPAMPEEQQTYIDMCAAQGWELVSAKGPMQLFRSAQADPIPIETDEGYKLHSIHAALKKEFLFSRVLLLISMILQLMSQWQNFRFNAFSMVSSNTSLSIVFALFTLLVYLAFDILWYFVWYARSKRAVAEGGTCVSPLTGLRKAMLWIPLAAALIMIAVLLIEAPSSNARIYYFSILAATFGIIALIMLLQKWFKKLGYPAKKARNLTMAAAVVLALALCGGMVWAVLSLDLMPLGDRVEKVIHLPEPALTLEDLMPNTDSTVNWATHEIEKSLLATYTVYSEDSASASLEYRLVNLRWDALRKLAFDTMAKRNHFTNDTRSARDDRWQAEVTYVRPTRTEVCEFIALYDDAILYINTNVPLNDLLIAQIEQALID